MTDEEDGLSPRERGLLFGYAWMENHDAVDQDELKRVLNGEWRMMIAELRERLDASESVNADEEFWNGFIDGARGYRAKIATGSSEN